MPVIFAIPFALSIAYWATSKIERFGNAMAGPSVAKQAANGNIPINAGQFSDVFTTTSPARAVMTTVTETSWQGLLKLGFYLGFAFVGLRFFEGAVSLIRRA